MIKWRFEEIGTEGVGRIYDGDRLVAILVKKEYAERIVKAVNSHDQLVKSVETFLGAQTQKPDARFIDLTKGFIDDVK